MKGRKLTYRERWQKHIQYGAPAFAGPKGEKLRQMRENLRREHRTRRTDSSAMPLPSAVADKPIQPENNTEILP